MLNSSDWPSILQHWCMSNYFITVIFLTHTSAWRTEEHTDVPTTSSSVINMVDVDAVIIWMGTSQIRNLQNMADVAESTWDSWGMPSSCHIGRGDRIADCHAPSPDLIEKGAASSQKQKQEGSNCFAPPVTPCLKCPFVIGLSNPSHCHNANVFVQSDVCPSPIQASPVFRLFTHTVFVLLFRVNGNFRICPVSQLATICPLLIFSGLYSVGIVILVSLGSSPSDEGKGKLPMIGYIAITKRFISGNILC